MRRITPALVALALLMGAPMSAHAETEYWLGARVDAEPIDDLELLYAQRIELTDSLERWQHTFRLDYTLFRALELGAGYRLSLSPDELGSSESCCVHRPIAQAQLKHRLGPVKLTLRLRGQLRIQENEELETLSRLRLKASWRTHERIRIHGSTESFWSPDEGFDASQRFDVGVRVALWEGLSANAFARYELVFEDEDDTTLGFDMRYSF